MNVITICEFGTRLLLSDRGSLTVDQVLIDDPGVNWYCWVICKELLQHPFPIIQSRINALRASTYFSGFFALYEYHGSLTGF